MTTSSRADVPKLPYRNLPQLFLRSREALLRHFRPIITHFGLTEQQWRALAATHAEGLGSAWWLAAGITALAVVGAFFHFYPMGWAA